MIVRLLAGGLIVACCGCSTANMHTDVASTKWRMENLEQRFLDFREKAAIREAGLSTRIAKLEKQLGLPVASQVGVQSSSLQITSDVRVFSGSAGNDALSSDVVSKKDIPAIAAETKSEEPELGTSQKQASVQAAPVSQPAAVGTTGREHPFTVAKAGSSPDIVSPQKPTVEKPVAATVIKKTVSSTPVKKVSSPSHAVAKSSYQPVKKAVSPVGVKNGAASMYKHGLQLLNDGDYLKGRERLEEFLTEFPNSTLVPNAVYWVGESFYSQKDYLVAIDLFREVLRRFPESGKAKAAMLKIGYSYKRLDEFSQARRHLLKVVEKYPTSNEARLARTMLSGI